MLKLPQKLTSNYLSVTLNQKKTNRKEFDTENRRVSEIKKKQSWLQTVLCDLERSTTAYCY